MSKKLDYKQVANVTRRKWDVEAYEKRAKDRAKQESTGSAASVAANEHSAASVDESKEEFTHAVPGAAGPHKSKRAFLKARSGKVDVDSRIGKVELVSPDAVATTSVASGASDSIKKGVTKSGVGWHCKVCDCFLKDSHTYLDHINGRKHQRNLGYSMRVERTTKDQLEARLEKLVKKKEESQSAPLGTSAIDFESVVKAKDEEEKRNKEERARKRKERKKMAKNPTRVESPPNNKSGEDQGDDGEGEIEQEEVNPEIAAMMGFAGFGSS